MGKTVESKPKQFSIGTLCRLMDDCLPEQIEDERDMQALINKLWPALVCEHEIESEKEIASIQDFLEKNAPVYDNWQMIDDDYCCEKILLQERERLATVAKGRG